MYFTLTNASRNLHRFYIVQLASSLFGEWTLLCEWGRIGSPGTVRLISFERQEDAERAERRVIKRRLTHGYIVRED